jgi:hypothetical protein
MLTRTGAAIIAACGLGQTALADDFHVKLSNPQQVGSWVLIEPLIFVGEHERFFMSPLVGGRAAAFGIGCSRGQYTLTFDLNGAAGDVTLLVVATDGKQQVFTAERGKTMGTTSATFAPLSSADLAAVAAAKTIDVHVEGQSAGVSHRVDGTAAALKALADYCARGE